MQPCDDTALTDPIFYANPPVTSQFTVHHVDTIAEVTECDPEQISTGCFQKCFQSTANTDMRWILKIERVGCFLNAISQSNQIKKEVGFFFTLSGEDMNKRFGCFISFLFH